MLKVKYPKQLGFLQSAPISWEESYDESIL